MFQVRMQDENGLAFFLEGGSFCLGLHPKTSKKPSSKGQVAISWHPFNQAVHDGSAGSPPRLVKQQQPTPDGQSPHDYAMDCGNPLKVLFWNQTLIHISTGVDLRFFSANFLYGMQQLTKKKTGSCFNVKDCTGISPPTNFTWRTLDRILQHSIWCVLDSTQNPSNSLQIEEFAQNFAGHFFEGEIR